MVKGYETLVLKGVIRSAADAETFEPRRRSGHQFHSASGQLKVGCQQPDNCIVCLAIDCWLTHADCQLTTGTDLDRGSLAAARLDLDNDNVGHAA